RNLVRARTDDAIAPLAHAAGVTLALTTEPEPILGVAERLGLGADELFPYGTHMAKIDLAALDARRDVEDGKLVCVTAITPTKAGEGKTTTAISLVDGLGRIGENVVA